MALEPAMMTSEQKEAMARQQGFQSYEAMMLYHEQRARRRAPQTVQGRPGRPVPTPTPTASPRPAADVNPWSLASVLNKITQTLRGQ